MISGLKFIRFKEFTIKEMETLFTELKDFPIKYNTKEKSLAFSGDAYKFMEPEVGDPGGKKFERTKSLLLQHFPTTNDFLIGLEYFPLDEPDKFLYFSLTVSNINKYYASIDFWISTNDMMTRAMDICRWFFPLIIRLFRTFGLEVGYTTQEHGTQENEQKIESLRSGKFDVLTGINFYTSRYLDSLPPHKGKEILLDEDIGLYCLVLHTNPFSYPSFELDEDEIPL